MTGHLRLWVEYDANAFWGFLTRKKTYCRRWRNANIMDLTAPRASPSAGHALHPFTAPATGASRLAHKCARARSGLYKNAYRSTGGGAQVELAVKGLRYCELSRGTLPPLQNCMT